MRLVYAKSGDDLIKIKNYGFDVVVGSFSLEELDTMNRIGLKCVFAGGLSTIGNTTVGEDNITLVEHPSIMAYYVYDEPDLNKISILEQDMTIAKYRNRTSKPLAIACIENTTRLCSTNYDWYMLDIYYLTEIGKLKKLINYLNVAFSTYFIKVLYKGKKVMPIVGVFDDKESGGNFAYDKEQYPFALKFLSYFRNEDDFAVFIWSSYMAGTYGVIDRPTYQIDALNLLHQEHKKCWWITDRFLTGIAYLVIWVRSIIPDSVINKVKGWFGIQ